MNSKIKYLNSYKRPSNFSKKPFNRSLTKILKKNGGRNNFGRVTVRHKGGGQKQRIRLVDFNFLHEKAIVQAIEYDPARSAFLAGCKNLETDKTFYTILSDGLEIGSSLGFKNRSEPVFKSGFAAPIKDFPLGSLVHSLELKPGKGSQLARSAGSYVKIIQKDFEKGLAKVKLPSKKEAVVSLNTFAVFGVVSNLSHRTKDLAKAGRSRWLGRRPSVRGVAMNPIDHPHGGGEGKTSGGRPSVTPWGRLTRGKPTRKGLRNTNKQF
jgi:large subunit ribosomal protein L2